VQIQPGSLIAGIAGLLTLVTVAAWVIWRTRALAIGKPLRLGSLLFFGSGIVANLFSVPGSRVGIQAERGSSLTEGTDTILGPEIFESAYQSGTGPLPALYCSVRNRRTLSADFTPYPGIAVARPTLTSPEAWAPGIPPADRRNVLFLVVESLRTDVIYDEGAFREIMPHVAALARDGAFFDHHYAVATHSNYSDIVPISSQYPLRSATSHLYPENPSYPTPRIYDLLKTQGYRTAIISSQDENWEKMSNYLASPKLDHFFHAANYQGATYTPTGDSSFVKFSARYRRSGKIDDHETIDEVVRWIEEAPAEPFYIYSNLQNSHFPYTVPEGAERPFAPEPFDLEIGFNSITEEHVDIMRRRYFDSLHYIDTQIGRLLERLEADGVLEDTLIIVTGDTGQAFLEHGFSCHANMLYDESLRTPLILHGPGIEPAIVSQRYCHLDVPPTILSYLGLPPYPGFQGVDALDRDGYDPNRMIFLTVQTLLAHQYGVMLGDLKFFTSVDTGTDYLFLLGEDPGETRNLAASAPTLSAELQTIVETWEWAQLSYYADEDAQSAHFPPKLYYRPNLNPDADGTPGP